MKSAFDYLHKIRNREIDAVFVGDEEIRDYLCYVTGLPLSMECISYQVFLESDRNDTVFYIIDDASRAAKCHDFKALKGGKFMSLSVFVNVLNDGVQEIPDRPVALWGAGADLAVVYDRLSKYAVPEVIIDKNKSGTYFGIPIVAPDTIDVHRYFIFITTARYGEEIRSILNEKGCQEGKDYAFCQREEWCYNRAEMFLKTIADEPLREVKCSRPFDYINVGVGGNMTHCCYAWLPWYVGNILADNSCDSVTSRIIRVLFMNHTYSFCNTLYCPLMGKERKHLINRNIKSVNRDWYLKKQQITKIDVAFDNTCNLYCESCRDRLLTDSSDMPVVIARKVKALMKTAEYVTIAGNGEIFLSKAYKNLLEGYYPGTTLLVLSNGNLFSEKGWELLDGHFKDIHLMFSIDAASKSTYEKIRRGGKWELVMRGLRLASALRIDGRISKFVIRFVVSAKNYMEMKEFVRLGIELHCDRVDFSRLENWGTFTEEEFEQMSMFQGENPKQELKNILDDPVFEHPIVLFSNI
mgnify:CR=1 FL=1